MPALTAIHLGGSPEPWLALGLTASGAPSVPGIVVGGVTCRFETESPAGVLALGVDPESLDRDPADARLEVDGLRFVAEAPEARTGAEHHPCGASLVDHVVVMTSSLDRTCGAVAESLGAPLKRVREVGNGVRQGFHRLGEVILEVVETPQVPAGAAGFWGLVFVVADLDAVFQRLGPDVLAPPKDAVQPGRRISNVRAAAGLGVPVALMTAELVNRVK